MSVATAVQSFSGAGLSPSDLAELIASFTDVTEKLQSTHEALRGEVSRLEAELNEAQSQLKRARELAALGEMAAGIAHEVRNPLGSIRLYASVLAEDLVDRPADRDIAIKIASAVSRLDAVVGDVLSFSRELTVRGEEVSVCSLLREASDACIDQWKQHGIKVHMDERGLDKLRLRCDPLLMHQALVNVMRNAAEAMGEREDAGRAVWIGAGKRRVLGSEGKRVWMVGLMVRDSGPGVPSDAMGRVFNPFFTTRHTGTGLGLAIVHRIVDAHEGRVVISNNTEPGSNGAPACGACVEFLLPMISAEGVGEQEQREAA